MSTEIKVEKPEQEKLTEMKVTDWPIWTKEVSTFDWQYQEKEVGFVLEGEVTVKTERSETHFGPGDMVTFPKGLNCTWTVRKPVRKHYKFG